MPRIKAPQAFVEYYEAITSLVVLKQLLKHNQYMAKNLHVPRYHVRLRHRIQAIKIVIKHRTN